MFDDIKLGLNLKKILKQLHFNRMATPRYNLRNASLYLTKLKNKYQKHQNEEENNYDNTFIDEQDELTSNQQIKKLSSKKINSSNTDRYESDNIENKQKQRSPSPQVTQTIEYEQKQIPQTQFCDLIVIKYLQETLAIYKGDLEILEHNRENLQQEIYFIGRKIGKLHQLVAENAAMNIEINQLNQSLKSIIVQYHESNKKLFRQKIAISKVFHKYQHKLKEFLLFNKKNDSDSNSYIKPDCLTDAYINEYSAFLNFKRQQNSQINTTIKNSEIHQRQKKSLVKKLFQGKQQMYISLNQTKKDKPIHNIEKPIHKVQQQVQVTEKNKEKKVVLYDEFRNDDEDFEKDLKSKDNKGKKMTEAEKNLLLGDLKNFSKSFKLPTK